MKRVFGSKKKKVEAPKGPSLQETSSTMGDRGKVIENKVADCDKQLAEIKAKMKGQKGMAYKQSQKRALMILKRRKIYTGQFDTLQSHQFNIDQAVFANEQIQTTLDMAGAMKEAVGAQKAQLKKINMDQMEDVMEDMKEMYEDQEEINDVLGRDYALDDYDETELLDELDELDDEIVNERLDEGTGVPAYMPQKGQEVPANKEEDDLAMMMN